MAVKTTVFENILVSGIRKGIAPAKSQKARNWYRQTALASGVTKVSVGEKARKRATFEIGSMFMFKYDPKTKETLPFYDTFPLIFPIEPAEGGFYGINLHYLPYRARAKLMDALYGITSDQNFDTKTKLKISYNLLKSVASMKDFKPCIKRYLSKQIRSDLIYVFPDEWDIALFLPIEQFKKQTKEKVWENSLQRVYGAR